MKEFFLWWLAIEAVGLAAFPLTYAFFRWLPDRGFAFSKVVGLLLLGYSLWMGATIGLFPNSRLTVIGLLLFIAGLSLVVAVRYREEMAAFLRAGWRYIAFIEVMFVVVLAAAVFIRSFAPEIMWGEKPFEFAFLNAINRSESFPPSDPWLAGSSISYYYFGYVMIVALTKLVALEPNVTFYLALSLMAALAAVTGFGVVYNMIAASRRRIGPLLARGPALIPRAVIFGLAAAGLMLVVSNLAGVFELLARHGIGSAGFYDVVGISGLNGPYDCAAAPGDCEAWYPTRFWWWWWATRIGSGFDIQEFPFFSFQFGDLHPHVLVMPLLIAVFAIALNIVLGARDESQPGDEERAERLDAIWVLHHPGRFLLLALIMGGAAFTDVWTIPVATLMILAAVMLANWRRTGGNPLRMILDSAGFALPVGAAMVLLYLPFYLDFNAETGGLSIIETAMTTDRPPPASESTRPLHFLLFWSPLLWTSLSFVAVYVYRRRREILKPPLLALSALLWALPIAVWAFLVLTQLSAELGWNPLDWQVVADPSLAQLGDELWERGVSLITVLMLILAITAVGLAFFHQLRRPPEERDSSQLFAFFLAGFALMMLLGAEFYFVNDPLQWRGNTVFRFWLQSWLILSIVAGFGLYRLTLGWRPPRPRLGTLRGQWLAGSGVVLGVAYTLFVALDPWDTLYSRWWTATPGILVAGASIVAYAAAAAARDASRPQVWRRLGWLGATVAILGLALVYPVTVALERTDGFRNDQSLNGLVHVQRGEPMQYEAIEWLNENVSGVPVILEAFGDDFSDAARISSRTGLPTVIGWLNHELQWRGRPSFDGSGTPFTERPGEVETIYTTMDVQTARSLLDKYDVEYVYVGRLEREKYGGDGLEKFRQFMIPVFENEGVTIYRMPTQETAASGSR
ncbi:MAG: hypothetical protein IIC87_03530 [Chloroflexi bacterium]|nr:hypothetical protein [Chloroflexota bacterium]